MSRYRPPAAKSTAIITAAGFERLKQELRELWEVRRPEVVAALSAAAAEGDRSENAEYIYRKKQLGELDRRIRFLSKRIPELKPVHTLPTQRDRVFFAAIVTLLDAAEVPSTYRIVGPDEIDPAQGWISVDSPVARALLGKSCGDEVIVPTPNGVRTLLLSAVHY
jgi:transcription elongation factor GreB